MSANERAFAPSEESSGRWFAQQPQWWSEHHDGAANELLDFLRGDGIETVGRTLVDLGCGDGIITLGLARQGRFGTTLGLDLVEVDEAFLDAQAQAHGVDPVGPDDHLTFARSEPNRIPLADDSVDVITAWSVFEHVDTPVDLLREVFRVLRPGGVIVIQVWPLWYSEHGSHLWPFFDGPFVQLTRSDEEVETQLVERLPNRALAASMFELYKSCNGATVDDIQAALRTCDLFVAKAQLTGTTIHVPASLQHLPLSKLAIDGFKILAVKQ